MRAFLKPRKWLRQRSARLRREGLAQRSWATGTREIVATGYRSDRPASPGGLEPPGPWLASGLDNGLHRKREPGLQAGREAGSMETESWGERSGNGLPKVAPGSAGRGTTRTSRATSHCRARLWLPRPQEA